MRRLTTEDLSEDVLSKLPLEYYQSIGGDKEKAIRQLNEVYQYLPKCYVKVNKGDYSILNDLMQKYIYLVKFK